MNELIKKIKDAQSAQQMEDILPEIKAFFQVANQDQKELISYAIKEKGEEIINSAQAAINQARAFQTEIDAGKLLYAGKEYDLQEWLTIARYCQLFGIANSSQVSNDINRNKVPKENFIVVPSLNNLCLIRAVKYK